MHISPSSPSVKEEEVVEVEEERWGSGGSRNVPQIANLNCGSEHSTFWRGDVSRAFADA